MTQTLPNEWRTFAGKNVTMQTIDQQHLSNVYWYMRIFHNMKDSELFQIHSELKERFNGQLLPYRPHISFIEEIQFLNEKEMIQIRDLFYYDIIFQNTIIGEITRIL